MCVPCLVGECQEGTLFPHAVQVALTTAAWGTQWVPHLGRATPEGKQPSDRMMNKICKMENIGVLRQCQRALPQCPLQ